jgi:hypothetical protein
MAHEDGGREVTTKTHDIYRSSNGDRWLLLWDSESKQGIVRHEPALSSGGRITETPVNEFLDRTGTSPENVALRALLEEMGEG